MARARLRKKLSPTSGVARTRLASEPAERRKSSALGVLAAARRGDTPFRQRGGLGVVVVAVYRLAVRHDRVGAAAEPLDRLFLGRQVVAAEGRLLVGRDLRGHAFGGLHRAGQ